MAETFEHPFAITMWDFSWLERRWPGAGYENWDLALDELVERGYNAVRIDAYPHLVSADPYRNWELLPMWNQMSWGAQSPISVQVLPALLEFIGKCRDRGVKVSLSSWYREDRDNVRMNIRTPDDHARIWIDTIRHIENEGLLDSILFVDLCNEFPLAAWAPYLYAAQSSSAIGEAKTPLERLKTEAERELPRTAPHVQAWMDESIATVRAQYPKLDYTYSFSSQLSSWRDQDVHSLDLLEPHLWMATAKGSDYFQTVGYEYARFESSSFDNLVANGRRVYEEKMDHWDRLLFRAIDDLADWSRSTRLGLITTEAWAVVDYKDWPGLDWDWVMELTEKGLRCAASTGRWIGLATSNFCGPQFVGMWRDVAWHQRLTTLIKSSSIDSDVHTHLDEIRGLR